MENKRQKTCLIYKNSVNGKWQLLYYKNNITPITQRGKTKKEFINWAYKNEFLVLKLISDPWEDDELKEQMYV